VTIGSVQTRTSPRGIDESPGSRESFAAVNSETFLGLGVAIRPSNEPVIISLEAGFSAAFP